MKFQLISDLHLEYYKSLPDINKIITPSAPNLILAGDICFAKHKNFILFFKQISSMFENIIYVLGNHEYYNKIEDGFHSIAEIEIYIKNKLKHLQNVHILQNNFIDLSGVVVIGCTLWSYLSKKDMVGDICILPNDFIKFRNKLRLKSSITNNIHLEHKKYLTDILEGFEEHKKLVITHFLPSKKCIDPKFKFDTFNKSYYSNCDDIVEKADIWCAGHTHKFMIKNINGTPVYINPVGYLWEESNYKKNLTFEI